MFERVARIYLGHAETDTVVAKTGGQAAVIAAAAATDKSQLLRGKPTNIAENRIKADDIQAKAAELAVRFGVEAGVILEAMVQARPEIKEWVQ